MGNVVERSSGPRNRWLLPVVLALLVAAIVLGAIFIPKLMKSSASATATPRVVVVTNAPTSGTTTAGAATGSTPTGGSGSTPLPGASPVPTQPGLVLGMITHPMKDVNAAQAGVDKKDQAYTFRLDPRQVVMQTLSQEGFSTFSISTPAASPTPTPYVGSDHRPTVKFIVSYKGQDYTVAVEQPGRQGATGVWFITTILQGQHLGP